MTIENVPIIMAVMISIEPILHTRGQQHRERATATVLQQQQHLRGPNERKSLGYFEQG